MTHPSIITGVALMVWPLCMKEARKLRPWESEQRWLADAACMLAAVVEDMSPRYDDDVLSICTWAGGAVDVFRAGQAPDLASVQLVVERAALGWIRSRWTFPHAASLWQPTPDVVTH